MQFTKQYKSTFTFEATSKYNVICNLFKLIGWEKKKKNLQLLQTTQKEVEKHKKKQYRNKTSCLKPQKTCSELGKKTWISVCPWVKQLSYFACLGQMQMLVLAYLLIYLSADDLPGLNCLSGKWE